MQVLIKNMVCERCKIIVKAEFEKLGLQPFKVELGKVEFSKIPTETQKNHLNQTLISYGFELIEDKKHEIIERIKNLIVGLVHQQNNKLKINLSNYLAEELSQNYHALSTLFSEMENITIEQYHILQKIEKVKELLSYDEMNLNEVANQLNYSSVAHLSSQFKKITGFTPTHFRNLIDYKRKGIDEI